MEKLIVYTNQVGSVALCVPTGELPIEEVQQKDIPEGVQSYIINRSDLPEDYYDFIDAWVQTEGVVTVDLNMAKEVTKRRLRIARQKLLEQQDILFQRALETGSDTTAIVAEKQRLRDVTNLADSCTTLEELRNLSV